MPNNQPRATREPWGCPVCDDNPQGEPIAWDDTPYGSQTVSRPVEFKPCTCCAAHHAAVTKATAELQERLDRALLERRTSDMLMVCLREGVEDFAKEYYTESNSPRKGQAEENLNHLLDQTSIAAKEFMSAAVKAARVSAFREAEDMADCAGHLDLASEFDKLAAAIESSSTPQEKTK